MKGGSCLATKTDSNSILLHFALTGRGGPQLTFFVPAIYAPLFQAKGPLLYEPRTADAVAAAQAVAAAAAAKLAAQAAWVAAAQAAQAAGRGSKPSQQQWAAGEHANRIAALKTASLKVVYPKVTEELARESLSLLGMKPHGPDPQHLAAVAWQLLLDLGAEQLHAPLPLLRTGLSMGAFPAAVEKEAEVRKLLQGKGIPASVAAVCRRVC